MNKNNVIFLLFVAALIGSTWGAVVNRQKIGLEQQLGDVRAELHKLGEKAGRDQVQVPGRTAGSRDSLAEKDEQLTKARQELVTLRKETQFLAGKLSGCNGTVQELTGVKETLEQQLREGREPTMAADQAPIGEQNMASLQQRLDEAGAQLLGLEKIIDENKAALREAEQEEERLRINMDVLLAKISDQQREVRSLQEENRELIQQLTTWKEQAALQDQQQSGNQ
jgi:chromosome segregation ATPase